MRAYNELAAMSDPELHDIGIRRSDIMAVAFGTCDGTAFPISDHTARGCRGRLL